MVRAVGVAVVCGIGLLFAPGGAAAEDGTSLGAARSLGYAGVADYQQGRYQAAADKLDRAYTVVRAPALGLWSARSLVKLGKLVEAAERYLEVTRLEVTSGEIAVQKKAQADAASERAELLPRIPSLVITLKGARAEDVRVTVNGKEVPAALVGARLPVNPGTHRVEAQAGDAKAVREVKVAEGESGGAILEIRVPDRKPGGAVRATGASRAPSAPDQVPASSGKTQRTIGWIALAAGGAGLAAGAISGGLALKKKGELEDADDCREDRCSPRAQSDVDGYMTLRTVSTVGLWVGAAGVGSGLVLLFTAPKKQEASAGIRPWLGVASAGVTGSFQ